MYAEQDWCVHIEEDVGADAPNRRKDGYRKQKDEVNAAHSLKEAVRPQAGCTESRDIYVLEIVHNPKNIDVPRLCISDSVQPA